MSTTPTRYHPALVTLHWLLAALIGLALVMGTFSLAQTPNAAPEKLDALRGHMVVGFAIGALMLVRLVLRRRTATPAPARTGNTQLDALAKAAHVGLYVLVFGMAASGMGLALQAGLPDIVFGHSGTALPENFYGFIPRRVHGLLAKLLMALVLLHVAGALYHQFVQRDGLMARMGFGKR